MAAAAVARVAAAPTGRQQAQGHLLALVVAAVALVPLVMAAAGGEMAAKTAITVARRAGMPLLRGKLRRQQLSARQRHCMMQHSGQR
jgi:hypothetical protein